MKFLLGTYAYNRHVQNIALALHEASALGACCTGGVDNYRHIWLKTMRRLVERAVPSVDRELRRRRITTVPEALVYADWVWEFPRTLASRLGLDARIQDWFCERGERRLDRRCTRLLERQEVDAFFGIEHGALSSIHAARSLGKKSVVAFLSPHHTTRERWVDQEYERFPELCTPSTIRLQQLAVQRDARRDEEASLADAIHTNSRFTANSLAMAGFPREKMVVVPLGSPPVISDALLATALSEPLRFVYAGPIAVHKGAHYLLDAWKRLACRGSGELHLYGIPLLPKHYFSACEQNVVLHGPVAQAELFAAYQHSAILVFPTLCDGFGTVVNEAMAHGLPVITTSNSGAADLVQEGQNGFLVPAGDVQALVERMEWCLRHPQELLAMRRDALATARRWTWADFRTALCRQLSRVLDIRLEVEMPADAGLPGGRPSA